jgi:hypothetical protein
MGLAPRMGLARRMGSGMGLARRTLLAWPLGSTALLVIRFEETAAGVSRSAAVKRTETAASVNRRPSIARQSPV